MDGETETEADLPVPESGTVCGLPVALPEIVIDAARLPLAAGVNLTLIVQLPFAATEVPQLFVWAKSAEFVPRTAMLVMVRGPFPELLMVTVWAALVAPTD